MAATAVCEPPVATGLTLGQLLAQAHEDVREHGVADCPTCGHSMRGTGYEARCDYCDSRLY
jgi:tRNA(Ile2) C34 agmatinyltransferase TiaS